MGRLRRGWLDSAPCGVGWGHSTRAGGTTMASFTCGDLGAGCQLERLCCLPSHLLHLRPQQVVVLTGFLHGSRSISKHPEMEAVRGRSFEGLNSEGRNSHRSFPLCTRAQARDRLAQIRGRWSVQRNETAGGHDCRQASLTNTLLWSITPHLASFLLLTSNLLWLR